MTKNVALTVLIVSVCACQASDTQTEDSFSSDASASEFEGSITYQTHLTTESDLVDKDHLNALYGDTLVWYYQHGNYRWQFNGDGPDAVTYLADSNVEYTQRSGIDSLFAVNVLDESRTLDSLYTTGESRSILGRNCHFLVAQVGQTRHTYCIDPLIKMDPAHFEAFKYGFVADRFTILPGAYLFYTYESPIFTIEREAIDIDWEALTPAHFALPDWPTASMGS